MRRSATRSIACLAAVAAAALSAAACSSGAPTSSSSATSAATQASVYSRANIDKILASYAGPDTKFPSSFGAAAQPAALKIGWSSPCNANELVSRLGTALGKEITALGGSEVTYDANCDVNAQVGQMQQLINDKVSAIVVWPLDTTSLEPLFARAKSAGIPVIAVEATPDGSAAPGVTGQIIYGRDEEAYLAAKLMSEVIPGAQVGVIGDSVPVPSITYYSQRSAYWAAQDKLKVDGTYDVPVDSVSGGESAGGPMLSRNTGIEGVLAYNDDSAEGVYAAARAAGRQVVLFGMNGEDSGIAAVKSGELAYTLQPPLVTWAKDLINAAYLAKNGIKIPATVYPGIGDVVTSQTVGSAQPLLSLIDSASYGG